jgi:hypothetical protein
MATSLTQAQIAALQSAMGQGYTTPEGQWVSTSQGAGYTDPSGQHIGMLNSSGAPQELFGNGMYTSGNYTPGGQYNVMDAQGADTGRTGNYGQDWSAEMLALKYMATLLAAGYGGAAAMEGGAAGAGGAAAGGSFTPAELASFEAGGLGGQGAAGLGAAGAGGGFSGLSSNSMPLDAGGTPYTTAAADSQAASDALGLPMVGGGSAPAVAANGGGLLTGFGGPIASIVGGLLGSQPRETEATRTTQIDPRTASYLFDQGGLFPGTQAQLQRSTSPERLAQNEQMRSAAMGLLSQPVAGNGFSRFFPGR